MAETINNSATTTYTLAGSSESQTATSNTLGVNFESSEGLTVSKTANPTTFSVGEIISYSVVITNTGSTSYSGIRIIDNLGGGHLAYVIGSGGLVTSSLTYPVTPVATNPLTFTLQELAPGQSMTLNYRAQVVFNLPSNVQTITNSVQGIGYTQTGTVNAFDNATIQKKNSATLGISKSSNVTTVSPNQSFNYLITLTNNNSVPATVSNITDNLPSNFTLTQVRLQIGTGSSTVLSPSDYTLSGGNTLVVPSSTGPSITVPANGTTVLTITGFLS